MRPPLARLAAAQFGAFSSGQALSCYSPAEVRARLYSGRWCRVLRHTLRHRTSDPGPRMRCAAATLEIGRPAVACLHTAAHLLGFGVLEDPVTHVAVDPALPCRRRPELWPHQFVLATADVVRLRCGTLCTSADRTAVDLARHLPALDAVPILDAALDTGICTPDSLQRELARHVGLEGVVQARRLVTFARRGPESPQESRMRWRCHEARLPPPTVQLPVDGRFLDLGWDEVKVGLEYDGAVHDGPRRRREDRRRHNALADAGWAMFYATDVDVFGPSDLFGRVRSAIERRSRR